MHYLSAPWKEAPMNVHYTVELATPEREVLRELIYRGSPRVRKVKRALILLGADDKQSDEAIAKSVGVGTATVYRTKRDFVERGFAQALEEAPRPGGKRKLTEKEELLLVALACSDAPPGRARWTVELLTDELVRLTEHEHIGKETVRRRLHDKELKPWQHKMWCIPKVDGEFVARMEDVVELYTQPTDPAHPVVCFDESPTQLIGETRVPKPTAPGLLARMDYEYRRNGTANLFVFVDAHQSWRHVKVTDHRTAEDFAHCMRELVDIHYPKAEKIRVVLDNLSTHSLGALYETFSAMEARRLVQRLEFHYTPKHASWLNMVEIEIGVLGSQCLDRRIPDRAMLEREVAAWQQQRNEAGARIRWLFDLDQARQKLAKSYPKAAADATAMESQCLQVAP
jgi:transposase